MRMSRLSSYIELKPTPVIFVSRRFSSALSGKGSLRLNNPRLYSSEPCKRHYFPLWWPNLFCSNPPLSSFQSYGRPQGLLCITHYRVFCVLRGPQILRPNRATPPFPSNVTSRVDLHPIEAYQDFGAGSQERKCSDDCNVSKEPT